MKNIFVTGAAGFIGSNFVCYMANKYPDCRFIVLDILDYCASLDNLEKLPNIDIVIGDISDNELVAHTLRTFEIDTIVHFAAHSHVDNSFFNSIPFTKTNVLGTHILLETVRVYRDETNRLQKFVQISTDEVYGQVDDNIARNELSAFNPSSVYASSKAAAEMYINAYYHSFKLPVIIARSNNCYGECQYPEKVVPKFICQLLNGEKLTIHGLGTSQRNFIHVSDTCKAVETILLQGEIGEIYNISAPLNNEFTVMEVASLLVSLIYPGDPLEDHITYVEDRKFNDCRYYISSEKLEKLGWKPVKTDFTKEVKELIEWYKINKGRYGF
ncbi:MAG: GDP-mannose 4,6 dehydratase [Barrevirus sp.]|uniref:GDP-mannose 4,6 dehydratase n=1 Tax=Barrevirus sp. TaxID=2487763 RepID=A0A3G4ZU56_9VIRU|nr:MAG: GDP-mannose 4,6 dehydratase [Barrevirus sp.]